MSRARYGYWMCIAIGFGALFLGADTIACVYSAAAMVIWSNEK